MFNKAELNGNEKLALELIGMEGEGNPFTVNNETAGQILNSEKIEQFNSGVNQYVDKFEKHSAALKEYAEKLSEDMNGLEIMPMGNYVLIKPFDVNPFQQIKVENGIITDLGGLTPSYKSNETGEIEESEQYIKVGTVIETGYDCKFIQTGDVVFYTIASEVPVPFFRQGFVTVAEPRVIAIVNEKLTERKSR